MFTLTITIGRNINDVPMGEVDWSFFKLETAAAVEAYRHLHANPEAIVVEIHNGFGYWDGKPEESWKIALIGDRLMDQDSKALRLELARLAATYKQDAIAFVPARSELVYPNHTA
jgi:hypothetical protein